MKIFIGWDSKQEMASKVCEYSMRANSSANLDITHLNRNDLILSGHYFRRDGDPSSTEFTYSRFLAPFLCNYKGWCMFVDSDFLFTADVQDLFNVVYKQRGYTKKAAYCVKHIEYTPKSDTKFYGKPQLTFPKKNWSSMIIFNNAHPSTRQLTPMSVSNRLPQWLHRFSWLNEEAGELGELPVSWNWLAGEYNYLDTPPQGIHFTNGGPFNEVYGQDYENLWTSYMQEMMDSSN
jgi:lipopolysaccharide biosynthesis glycosyltransferase